MNKAVLLFFILHKNYHSFYKVCIKMSMTDINLVLMEKGVDILTNVSYCKIRNMLVIDSCCNKEISMDTSNVE